MPTLKETIKHFCRQHIIALRHGCWHFTTTPLTTFITIATIAISFALPMGLYLVLKNAEVTAERWDTGRNLSVYLTHNAPETVAREIQRTISAYPSVERVEYLSAEAALTEFQSMTSTAALFEYLPENPLPAVLTVYPVPEAGTLTLKGLAQEVQALSKVEEVVLDWQWLARLQAILHFMTALTGVFALVLGLGVVFVVGNTIRLLLEKHRDEIDIHALVGATYPYVRRPFLYRGMLYGVLGFVLAYLLIAFSLWFLEPSINHLAKLYHTQFHLVSLDALEILSLFCFGALMGWLGAWIAVRQQWQMVNQGLSVCPT